MTSGRRADQCEQVTASGCKCGVAVIDIVAGCRDEDDLLITGTARWTLHSRPTACRRLNVTNDCTGTQAVAQMAYLMSTKLSMLLFMPGNIW
jgi:hypothetical protein